VSFAFATLDDNVFNGHQQIWGNLDLPGASVGSGVITKNGVRFLHNFGPSNTFVGEAAGNFTMTGGSNTAVGESSLTSNTEGHSITAVGRGALQDNQVGIWNTATGAHALANNVSGDYNTATGVDALQNNIGSRNTATGVRALQLNTVGFDNVAVGYNAGVNQRTGSNNIYLGANVEGVDGEIGTMRLGNVGVQIRTFISGVRGLPTGLGNAVGVLIDSNGQLGTINSSRRFKEDIHNMADASRRLYQLRPVTFHYTQAYKDGSKPIQYGLIAEEVAEAFPELAARGADGEIETVHYETLSVLLLNEVQKQQKALDEARERIEKLERQLEAVLGQR
jgi:trimeric autotransporter adhesin